MIDISTRWPSPAKLNLFLYINGRTENGYHELQTLFQFVDHGDELTIQANKTGNITLTPEIEGVPLQDNLIWKAATALQEYAQCHLGAHIDLKKFCRWAVGLVEVHRTPRQLWWHLITFGN